MTLEENGNTPTSWALRASKAHCVRVTQIPMRRWLEGPSLIQSLANDVACSLERQPEFHLPFLLKRLGVCGTCWLLGHRLGVCGTCWLLGHRLRES
jgi:hypothetical protein